MGRTSVRSPSAEIQPCHGDSPFRRRRRCCRLQWWLNAGNDEPLSDGHRSLGEDNLPFNQRDDVERPVVFVAPFGQFVRRLCGVDGCCRLD